MSVAILHVLYLVAITAEAATAALAAGRRKMDWVGVCLLAAVTALGGGSTRDILLSHHPLVWVAHPNYLLVVIFAALATIVVARIVAKLRRLFLFLDAVGLVVFTIIGCNVGLELELPVVVVIASGMITGCVGGVLRDILCNEVPLLFRSELYASVSVVTGAIYVGGLYLGLAHDPLMFAAMRTGLAMRLLALRFNGTCRSSSTPRSCTEAIRAPLEGCFSGAGTARGEGVPRAAQGPGFAGKIAYCFGMRFVLLWYVHWSTQC